MISLQFKNDIARESRAISVFTCSDIARDRRPLYQIVKDTSKIDNGYQLFQTTFGYKVINKRSVEEDLVAGLFFLEISKTFRHILFIQCQQGDMRRKRVLLRQKRGGSSPGW